MTTPVIELPFYTSRNVPSPEFLDCGDRLYDVLVDAENGCPTSETVIRECAEEAGDALSLLSTRLGLDRKGKFTEEKARLDKNRRAYYNAIQNGVRDILKDPDPEAPMPRREAAVLLSSVLAKRSKGFTRRTKAETSTELRNFFADAETDALQHVLKVTDLLRYYKALKIAHHAFVETLRKEGVAETDPEPVTTEEAADATSTKDIPLVRALKETITDRFRLAFEIMAHHARRDREPFAQLLTRCRLITDDININLKTRATRSRKAEEKQALAEGAAPRHQGKEGHSDDYGGSESDRSDCHPCGGRVTGLRGRAEDRVGRARRCRSPAIQLVTALSPNPDNGRRRPGSRPPGRRRPWTIFYIQEWSGVAQRRKGTKNWAGSSADFADSHRFRNPPSANRLRAISDFRA